MSDVDMPKGIEYVVKLCFGTSIENKTKRRVKKAIRAMRNKKWLSKDSLKDIMDLGEDPEDHKFNNVLNPLRGKKDETVPVQVVVRKNISGQAFYGLSWSAFKSSITNLKKPIRYYLKEQDLEDTIESLERRLELLRSLR